MRALLIVIALAGTAMAEPRDFTADVKTLHAIAACGGTAPSGFDADVVAAHCKALGKLVDKWKTDFRDKAAPFFAKEVPKAQKVVYPFGGGDLLTALVVYPDATEYTTLSLEGMGDPRTTNTKHLASRLSRLRDTLEVTFSWAWNTTIQLSIDSSESGTALPAILTSALVALDANGYEPLEVRYFTLDKSGAITYVTQADVDAWDQQKHSGDHKQTNSAQKGLFDDIEITFRAKAGGPTKTFRHVTADLSDGAVGDNGALAYLATLGPVSTMTKAASYLLWKPSFGKLRDLLLAQMTVMVSDDTGIPPHLLPTGFTQRVWGTYKGAHFGFADRKTAKELVDLWKSDANQGALAFRFGYYDNADHPHLMITSRQP
jgi:hypothetical protein